MEGVVRRQRFNVLLERRKRKRRRRRRMRRRRIFILSVQCLVSLTGCTCIMAITLDTNVILHFFIK